MTDRFAMRGTGRTTAQMKAAPSGAVYIWVHHNTHYPEMLAKAVDRQDLRIYGPEALTTNAFRGRVVDVVVDHAAELNFHQRFELEILQSYARMHQ